MKCSDNLRTIEKVVSFVENHGMIDSGDGIVIGLSGGADSVCLLFLLCALREKYGLRLKAVHVNHGIRGEAGEDAAFAEEICRKMNVDIEVVCEDVPARAAEWGASEEEAGRIVRYRAFEKIAGDSGFNKIAVAHNMNDNAETVLFHMFRGSGLHGLTGIPVSRQSGQHRIIRPILCLERSEIEQFLKNEGIGWVTDRTNLEDEYSRNRIRHNILPEAEKIAKGAAGHICETAMALAETEELLLELEKKCLDECVTKISSEKYIISVPDVLKHHKVVIKRTVLTVLGDAAGGKKDIGSLQVAQIMDLIEKSGNRHMDIAKGLSAERSYDNVVIKCKKADISASGKNFSDIENSHGGINDMSSHKGPGDFNITVTYMDAKDIAGGIEKLLERSTNEEFAKLNKYTKWLDYDKINGQLLVRTRQPGDFITVSGGDGRVIRKSLKDYMINCKIPADMRDSIPIAAVGNHCIWLAGYRISETCKLSMSTKKIVKLQLVSTEDDNCAES